MLYSSAQVATRDQGGCAEKFQVPTIANGKVYVSTKNELDVFGLLGEIVKSECLFVGALSRLCKPEGEHNQPSI